MGPRRRSSPLAAALILALVPAAPGCGGGSAVPRASLPDARSAAGKCRVAASFQSPLVTEWPASEKANFEALLAEGGVVVSYSGCEMRILPQCHVRGTYAWLRTTPATDHIEIRNEDELYTKLPLGAASLEGELRATGRLAVHTTISGQLQLRGLTPAEVPTTGACAGATHLVGALSVGAFSLTSGGSLRARGGADTPFGGASGGTSSQESLVREAGRAEACREGTDTGPHVDCGSPVQVFLWPLPSAMPEQGPPGTLKVNLVSGKGSVTWEVLADGRTLCRTPCSRWLPPSVSLTMNQVEGPHTGPNDTVDVPSLWAYDGSGPVEVIAKTKSTGKFVVGVTFTTLGGVATVAGAALTPVGFGVKNDAMAQGGLITLAAGIAVMVPSIWLITSASAEVEVRPAGGMTTALGESPRPLPARPAVQLAPGVIRGQF